MSVDMIVIFSTPICDAIIAIVQRPKKRGSVHYHRLNVDGEGTTLDV